MKPTGKGKFWEVKALNAATNSVDVLIYGDIGESWWGESIDAKSMLDTVAQIPASARIKCRINSNGGSVADALAIVNMFQRHSGGVDTVCDGIAASSAGLILMCGETATMAENGLFMVHAPWSYAEGNAADLRNAADTLDIWAQAMATVYARKTGKPTEEMMALLTDGKDHWYASADALAQGFVNEIGAALAIAAHATRFPRRPDGSPKPPEEKPTMTDKTKTPPADPSAQTVDESAIQAKAKSEAMAAEKSRREGIRTAFAKFAAQPGVQAILDAALDDPDTDIVQARAKLLDHLGAGVEPANPAGYVPRITYGETEREKKIKAFGNVLAVKAGLEKRDGQNPFQSYNLLDMAREILGHMGIGIQGMDRLAVARAALLRTPQGAGMTTSDFPILLENILHKSLLQGFIATTSTYDRVAKLGSVSDFREWPRLKLGLVGGIDDVLESGEYRYGSIPDATKESVSVKRKGKIIQITPEIIINDDLGGLVDIATQMGAGAKRSIDKAFYVSLAANPTMRDTKAFFHSDHGNLAGTAAKPTETSLLAAKNAMRSQKDPAGTDFIEVSPFTFVGPVGYDDTVNGIINAQYSTDSTPTQQKPNLVRSLFTNVIGTPRLEGTAWYVFGDPAIAPAWEVVFLDNQREPMITTEQDFDTSGIKHKVELPFGVAPIDTSGAYKNAGA